MGGAGDTDASDSNQAAQTRMRRRQRKRKRGVEGWLRSRRAGRLLTLSMALTTAAYVGANTFDAWTGSNRYGDVHLGMTQDQVRTALGAPAGSSQDGTWAHPFGGRSMLARYGADGLLQNISCREQPGSLELCPATLGIRIGTLERDLKLQLGAPDEVAASGSARLLHYHGVGLTFRLEESGVSEIRLSRSDNPFGFVRQVGWMLIP